MINKSILKNCCDRGFNEEELYGAYKIFFGTLSSEPRLKIINLLRKNKRNVSEIIEELKSRSHSIAEAYGISIQAIEPDLDHLHILFTAKPQTDLLKFINNWKSATSKVLQRKFHEQIKNKLWNNTFWSGSYCLITTGRTTLEQVKKYVESQGQ